MIGFIRYDDLDPCYQEAEEVLGVSGEQDPPAIESRRQPLLATTFQRVP